MAAKVVNIETARIARTPQAHDEIWEVGRRGLDVSIAELERKGEQPELLLAVQASGQEGVVQTSIVPSSAPPTALVDFVLQAMRQPMIGKPRRPQLIRVNSPTEAKALRQTLAAVGVRLEVSAVLPVLDALVQQMGMEFGGSAEDYRTRAARTGEPLSDEALRELFDAARAFYRTELWLDFGDEVMFEIELEPAQGAPKTLYGIVLGSMGQEFGLALYGSLDEFQRFYEFSLQHTDQLEQLDQPVKGVGRAHSTKMQQRQEAEMLSQLSTVSAVGLTFTPQRDVPQPLIQEAKQLRLPLANKSAFPLVIRLSAGGMTVGSVNDLRDVYAATRAILDWDRRINALEVDDDIDVSIASKLPGIADFLPAMTIHTTLRLNPFAPEEEQEMPSDLSDFFRVLFDAPPERTTPPRKKSPPKGAGKTLSSAAKKAKSKSSMPALPRPSKSHPDGDHA